MFKNTASQKWVVFAFQGEGGANPGAPVTGDAANITANLRLDGGAANAVDDTNPTELEDGFYAFDITAAESNADSIVIAPASSTSDVLVIGCPAALYTRDWAAGDVAAILVDTSSTLDTHLTDIKGATFSGATDSLEAIRNRGDSAWAGGPPTSDSGTAQAGSLTTITLAAGAPAADNILEGQLIFITAGTGVGQAKAIAEDGYDGTTKVATIIGEWEVTPDNTSVYDIYPNAITEFTAAPTAAQNADAVWDEATAGHTTAGTFGEQLKNDVDAILADTAELQADWVNGGRLDLLLDATLADTNELQTDWANGGRLDLLLDATLADTNELQTDWANGGRLDLILDARAAEATVAALNDVSVADILTTQMTEAYAADGVAPTLAQSLFFIQQLLSDFAIASTTMTVRKLDGSTAAATLTLNSASAPTSITRST